jgi:hypothetical protein
MEYLWFIVLGLGAMFLMSRGHGGMGCCGGNHGDHHAGTSEHDRPSGRESRSPQKDLIDLRKDEYAIMTPGRRGLSPSKNAEHQEMKT